MKERTILITNYHPTATAALIRDFKKIGFRVLSPDSNWNRISYFAPNDGLGSELISQEDYNKLAPGWVLLTCKPQESDLLAIAGEHGDSTILNIAQQGLSYESKIAEIMICPDMQTYERYCDTFRESILYFPRPHMSSIPQKNISKSFDDKVARSFVSKPDYWPKGTEALQRFAKMYAHRTESYGIDAPDGFLAPEQCIERMASGLVTLSFKEAEAYGLSCLESMMVGTPVASLNAFMTEKTLGHFFLDQSTSILADTVEELVERLSKLSLDEYGSLSEKCRERVLGLTTDERTTDKLAAAIDRVAN